MLKARPGSQLRCSFDGLFRAQLLIYIRWMDIFFKYYSMGCQLGLALSQLIVLNELKEAPCFLQKSAIANLNKNKVALTNSSFWYIILFSLSSHTTTAHPLLPLEPRAFFSEIFISQV